MEAGLAIQRMCSVENCDRKAHGRGYCHSHYVRWRRHGDPILGQSRAKAGEPDAYLENVVLKSGQDECLIWPYCRSGNGYAAIQQKKTPRSVSRLVCEAANGAPPDPSYQAAHSCGRGHEGCVNRAHLSWKTPAGNMADMVAHGTNLVGRRNGKTKLTEAAVRHIRAAKGAMTTGALATRYQITPEYVWQIQNNRTWRWLH